MWTTSLKDVYAASVSAERVRVEPGGDSFTVSAVDKDLSADDDIGSASGFAFKGKDGSSTKRGGAMSVTVTFSRAVANRRGDMDH